MKQSIKKCSPSPKKPIEGEDESSNDSDSTTGKLKIVTTPDKRNSVKCNKKRKRKQRRKTCSDDEEESEEALIDQAIEEKLQEVARKNNLSQIEMKKILKKLVGNEHVLALVKIQEDEEKRIEEKTKSGHENLNALAKSDCQEDDNCAPKLTRAKARALNKKPIPLPALNETEPKPEVAALISQDLHSDEDDEEYHPHEDDLVSDDDPNTTISDIDSQPATPNNPTTPIRIDTPVHYSQDGIFKLPRDRNDSFNSQTSQHEEIIAKRTRSKLCLQTTAIETIESNFVPPDITTDMYDLDVDMDHAWMEFLNEFSKPLNATTTVEEDDEADPEYIAADKVPIDREELRDVNISKKELSDLVTELFDGLVSSGIMAEEESSSLETPKKILDRSNDRSPMKKRQKITESPGQSCQQFESSDNIFSTISTDLNVTQTGTAFNPNIMSTPENNNVQKMTCVQGNQQEENIPSAASYQYYNPPLSAYPPPATPILPQAPVIAYTGSTIPPVGTIIPYNTILSYPTENMPAVAPFASVQGANPIYSVSNPPPALLAFQIPGTSAQSPTIPFGSIIAVPASNNRVNQPLKPLETIDLTQSPEHYPHSSVTAISPIACNIKPSALVLKPTTSHPEPSLPQSTTTSENSTKKRKKRQNSYNDLSYFHYDKWRNDVHVSINKYMRREYVEKYEELKSVPFEEPQFEENQKGFTDLQLEILQQQMQIHVQFAAQNFFQTYSHPEFWKLAEAEKQLLLDLERRSDGKENSPFNPWNLKPTLSLIKDWEDELSINNSENRELMDFLYAEIDKVKTSHNHTTPIMRFHPRIMKRILSSKAFMYPDLLPRIPFRIDVNIPYHEFSPAEDHLIALGMERYFKQLQEEEKNNPKYNRKISKLRIVCERISRDVTVGKNWRRILGRVKSQSESEEYNPIKFYNERKRAPPFRHDIKPIDLDSVLAPKDRIPDLPLAWKEYACSLKSVHLEKIIPQQDYVEPLKNSSEKVNQIIPTKTLSSTLEKTFNRSQDNTISSANIVIHFNYVLDSSLSNHSENLRTLLSSNFFNQSEKLARNHGGEFNLEILEQKNPIFGQCIHDDQSDRVLDSPEISSNLNFSSTECNNYLSTPCSSRAASANGSTLFHQLSNNKNSDVEKVNLNEKFKRTKEEVDKGQKLLTDYFPIEDRYSKKCKEETLQGRKDTLPPKYFRRTLKRKKIKFFRFNHHRFISKNHSKILNEVKRTKRLKIKFCFLVESYHTQLENFRKKYDNKDLKCIFMHFKTLDLYTNLLVDLMMSCRKGKVTVNSEETSCPKKAKLSNETASNAKVRKAMRVNEYLKRMIAPENQENINKKDAIYALNFYDKVEESFKKAGRNESFRKFQNILKSFDPDKDEVADMYNKIEKLFLPHYPDLAEIFLTFLLPGEAAQVGKFFEHFIMSNMGTFINKLNLYFSKQPAQIKKVYAALNELSEDGDLTIYKIKEKILPLLKGNQFLTEWFLQIFPSERPPARLVTITESINFKTMVGHKSDGECENIPADELISDVSDDEGCQIKYLNGRIFYGSKILLPAKLTFLAEDNLAKGKHSDTESDEDNSPNENSKVCMHGIRDLAEKRLKQATETCDEPEKSEEDENRENSKKYIVCDNPTFKAHAIRLNPSLYTSDNASNHKRTSSPKKPPKLNLLITTKDKEKRKSPKKNLPKSPGTKRSPNNSQSNISTIAADPGSKAIVTAKKLKSMLEGSLSDDQIKSKKQKINDKTKVKEENNDSREAEDKIILDDNLSDTESSQRGNDDVGMAEVKASAWTRDEDKIILEEVKFGFDSEEFLIDKLARNLPHRTESEIIHRHQFLMDVLSELQSRT